MRAVSTLNLRSARGGWGSVIYSWSTRTLPPAFHIPALGHKEAGSSLSPPGPFSGWCWHDGDPPVQFQCSVSSDAAASHVLLPLDGDAAQLHPSFNAQSEPIMSGLGGCCWGMRALHIYLHVRVYPCDIFGIFQRKILLLLLSRVKVTMPVISSTSILPHNILLR